MEYTFIAITPKSSLIEVVEPVRVQSMGQIEQFNHLIVRKWLSDIGKNYLSKMAMLENI